MYIEQALRTQLLASSAVTDVVGQGVYYAAAPQDATSPYVVISKISGVRDNTMDGPSGLVEARFQFSIFALQYKLCKDVAAAIDDAISGFKGMMGGAGGVNVNGVFYENETDLPGPETRPETALYGLAADYKLWHGLEP